MARADSGLGSRGKSGRPAMPLLAEAGLAIIGASLAIRLLPVRRLASWMNAPVAGSPAPEQTIAQLVRALKAWSRRLPWRTRCFEEGLSAHWMLRRRGLASTLHYGAATIDGELQAHVWVKSGSAEVTGCETAADFALLARFPEP